MISEGRGRVLECGRRGKMETGGKAREEGSKKNNTETHVERKKYVSN